MGVRLRTAPEGLTRRHKEVLQQFADGADGKEAAVQLGITEQTVRTHLKDARARLGARNTAHAIAMALRRGEIS